MTLSNKLWLGLVALGAFPAAIAAGQGAASVDSAPEVSATQSSGIQFFDFGDGQWPNQMSSQPELDEGGLQAWSMNHQDADGNPPHLQITSEDLVKGKDYSLVWQGPFEEGALYFDFRTIIFPGAALRTRLINAEGAKTVSEVQENMDWIRDRVDVEAGTQAIHWAFRWNGELDRGFEYAAWVDNILYIPKGHDGDADGLPDIWEKDNHLDYNNPVDAGQDADSDGLTNLEEYQLGTDFRNTDSDGDQIPDGWEVKYGLDPVASNDGLDADGDGFTDIQEYRGGSNPKDAASGPALITLWHNDFESGVLPEGLRFIQDGRVDWSVKQTQANSGTAALTHGDMSYHGTQAQLIWEGNFSKGTLVYAHRTDNPSNSCIALYVDGVKTEGGRPDDWTFVEVELEKGYHELRWQCEPNLPSAGFHWIDDLAFFAKGQDTDGDSNTDLAEWKSGHDLHDAADSGPDGRTLFDFEAGQLPVVMVTGDGATQPWSVSLDPEADGGYVLLSPELRLGRSGGLDWRGDFVKGSLYFDYKTDIKDFDEFRFSWSKTDGDSKTLEYPDASGGWQRVRFNFEAGFYQLAWHTGRGQLSLDRNARVMVDNVFFLPEGYDGDKDGMEDAWEYEYRLDISDPADGQADLDGDGLSNALEYQHGSLPNSGDSDGDGLSDGDEVHKHGTSPSKVDSDGDKMPDNWELANNFDPTVDDGSLDADQDGVSNYGEYKLQTDPNDASSVSPQITPVVVDFEDGDVPAFLQRTTWSIADWLVSDIQKVGNYSLTHENIRGLAGRASMLWHGNFAGGTLKFDYWLDSNAGFQENIYFYVDGKAILIDNFSSGWESFEVVLEPGYHELLWESDMGWPLFIDNITLIAPGKVGITSHSEIEKDRAEQGEQLGSKGERQ